MRGDGRETGFLSPAAWRVAEGLHMDGTTLRDLYATLAKDVTPFYNTFATFKSAFYRNCEVGE